MRMNKYKLFFHHLGLAVRQPEMAIRFLSGLEYEIGPSIRDDLQNVNLIICIKNTMPAFEIISETKTAGPLTNILKSNSSLIYHVCYESDVLDESLAALESDGFRVIPISEPKPAVLFAGRKVSFYHVHGFGLIEILEK